MSTLRKAPIVNLNTAALIKELVGEYNKQNQYLIHEIAESEEMLIKGCTNMHQYKGRIQDMISDIEQEYEAGAVEDQVYRSLSDWE